MAREGIRIRDARAPGRTGTPSTREDGIANLKPASMGRPFVFNVSQRWHGI